MLCFRRRKVQDEFVELAKELRLLVASAMTEIADVKTELRKAHATLAEKSIEYDDFKVRMSAAWKPYSDLAKDQLDRANRRLDKENEREKQLLERWREQVADLRKQIEILELAVDCNK